MVPITSSAAGPFRKTSSHQNWLATLTFYVFLRALRALSGRQRTDAQSRFWNPLALTRFAPSRRPILLAGFLTLVSFQLALGAVEGFEESFDGTGPFATISQNLAGSTIRIGDFWIAWGVWMARGMCSSIRACQMMEVSGCVTLCKTEAIARR